MWLSFHFSFLSRSHSHVVVTFIFTIWHCFFCSLFICDGIDIVSNRHLYSLSFVRIRHRFVFRFDFDMYVHKLPFRRFSFFLFISSSFTFSRVFLTRLFLLVDFEFPSPLTRTNFHFAIALTITRTTVQKIAYNIVKNASQNKWDKKKEKNR